jgi:hypothetical protein
MLSHVDAAVRIIGDPLGLTEENSPCKPLNPEPESAAETNAQSAVGLSESNDDSESGILQERQFAAAVIVGDDEPGAITGGVANDLAQGYRDWSQEHFNTGSSAP